MITDDVIAIPVFNDHILLFIFFRPSILWKKFICWGFRLKMLPSSMEKKRNSIKGSSRITANHCFIYNRMIISIKAFLHSVSLI